MNNNTNENNTNENKIMVDTFVKWIEKLSYDNFNFYFNYQQLTIDKQILELTEWYILTKPKKYEKLLELQYQIKSGLGF